MENNYKNNFKCDCICVCKNDCCLKYDYKKKCNSKDCCRDNKNSKICKRCCKSAKNE